MFNTAVDYTVSDTDYHSSDQAFIDIVIYVNLTIVSGLKKPLFNL